MVVTTILVLEDDPNDVELLNAHFRRHELDVDLMFADQLDSFRQHLAESSIDVVLADYSLPTCTGFEAIEIAQRVCPEIPCILISGVLGEERAVEALQRGAVDYVLKQRMDRLVPALNLALEEKQQRLQLRKATEALQKSEEQFRTSVENMQDCFVILKPLTNSQGRISDLTLEYLNSSALNYLGFPETPTGETLLSAIPLLKPLKVFEHLCYIASFPQQSLQEEVKLQGLVRPPQDESPTVALHSFMSAETELDVAAHNPGLEPGSDLDLLSQQFISLDIRAVSLPGDRIVMTWRDMTQQQRHAQKQAKALKQFQKLHLSALSERRQVLDSLSQELKIAIASVQGCTQLLQLERLSLDQQQQVLYRLQQCNEHLSKILAHQQVALATQPVQAPDSLLLSEQQNAAERDSIQLDGISVLIIDDLDDACEVAKLALEIYGAERVEVCRSAAEGMEKLAGYRPDVLIVDIQMPQQDGHSFIRQLRNLEDEKLSLIPAIAFTANALEEDKRQAILAGFQLHVSKPIDIEFLARAVGAVASQNRSSDR